MSQNVGEKPSLARLKNSSKKFLDPDQNADDYENSVSFSLFMNTSLDCRICWNLLHGWNVTPRKLRNCENPLPVNPRWRIAPIFQYLNRYNSDPDVDCSISLKFCMRVQCESAEAAQWLKSNYSYCDNQNGGRTALSFEMSIGLLLCMSRPVFGLVPTLRMRTPPVSMWRRAGSKISRQKRLKALSDRRIIDTF